MNWTWFAWVCVFHKGDVILVESIIMLGIFLNLIGLSISLCELFRQLGLRGRISVNAQK